MDSSCPTCQGETTEARPVRKKLEERIAEQVIEAMEAGGLPPWSKGWAYDPTAVARNCSTGRPYRGVNVLLTEMSRMAQGYGDPRWLTYRQAQDIGRQVRRGERSTMIVYWKFDAPKGKNGLEERLDRGEAVGAEDAGASRASTPKRAPLARLYNVFNVEQTDGDDVLDPPETAPERTMDEAAEAAEAIVAGWEQRPEMRLERGNLPPRYDRRLDLVLVPELARYGDPADYYTSVFHELVHATGHQDRLKREMGNMDGNLHQYGREEMVAGIGAAMLSGRAGFRDQNVERDAAYVEHWRRTIDADHAAVIYAAQKAQHACDLILGERLQEAL